MDGAQGDLTPDAFAQLVRRLAEEIPRQYLDGIAAIDVSPRAVPHPSRADVFTLGACIPMGDAGEDLTSRVVLYHGSFRALAQRTADFDWRGEAWETLTHELRHHLEWRAHADRLEDYDWAVEQNFARQAGEAFDPVFFLAGEPVEAGTWQVEDDVFVDRPVRAVPGSLEFPWRGHRYRLALPEGHRVPLLVAVEGVRKPPDGTLFVVLRPRSSLRAWLLRRAQPGTATATAERLGATGATVTP